MKFKLFMIAGMSAVLAACASTPPATTEAPPSEPPQTTRTDTPGTVDQGPVPGTEAHFVATAGDRVFYDLDRSTLTAAGRETLRRQADWLNAYPGTDILIAGNCDERGTREYNLALGARRANAARDYLVSLGVSPSRIQTVSYGKERPTCRESSERCWALNRNAITMISGGVTG
ncbi:peptidoglycan-associated lipoprotein Pal [Hyphobacterium indicum]|jgi:peptidoglycan-associated lipoprotein|uniref:peptidoglycan-associated lipoprotein Pal n=1 Tax=Hyphobacterium indicum TaxID=2162714 RepID=UPI000D64EA2F|nr:peptidoglycan-associated lipoprotein Pal [Hyphobacterium indicum]